MQQPQDGALEFEEVQTFRQWWLWVLLLGTLIPVVGVFGYGLVQQLLLGQPWGSRPLPDWGLLLSAGASILVTGGVGYLMWRLRLVTQVRDDGLVLHFYPLRRRQIPWGEIVDFQVRSYRPLREYGGWGIRFSRAGVAYTVSGNQGVQLQLRTDRPLLVGSQQAPELAAAIRARLA